MTLAEQTPEISLKPAGRTPRYLKVLSEVEGMPLVEMKLEPAELEFWCSVRSNIVQKVNPEVRRETISGDAKTLSSSGELIQKRYNRAFKRSDIGGR